jgi:hypothetical protein
VRIRDLATEAWRNVSTGAARPLTAAALVVVPVLGLVSLETSTVNSTERDAAAFRNAQSAVFVLSAARAISGPACDTLTSLPGITAAGAVRSARHGIVPDATPYTEIPLFEATAPFGDFVGVDLERGVAVEQDIAESYGLGQDKGLWRTDAGNLILSGSYRYPDDGRNPQLQYAVVGEAVRPAYDQCWIETWPFDPQKSVLLYSTIASSDAVADATLTQLNPRNGSELKARAGFFHRPSRWTPWLAFFWSLAAVFGVSRIRRLEFAFARHLGARRQDLGLLVVLESLAWALPFTAVGLGALSTLGWTDDVTTSSAWFGARVLGAALLGVVIGAAVGGAANRERDLFSFFKRRT